MPKRTLVLIICLILLTIGLVTFSVYKKPQNQGGVPTPTPTVSFAKTTLTMSSTPVSTISSNLLSLPIAISTGDNKVTGIQLELSYDPKAISEVSIEPSGFIPDPVVLLKKVDPQTGRISLAFAVRPGNLGVSGQGTVATITFVPITGTQSTTISFLPTTQVSAQGLAKTVLKSALSTTVNFGVIPTATKPAVPIRNE